jgi:hypothetical protein
MRGEVAALLLVVVILVGGGAGYLIGNTNTRASTSISTATTTVITTTTNLATSSLTVTYTATQRTTITSLVEPASGPLVILGASISHNLPQRALIFSLSKSLNASSYVAIENNSTGTATFTQLVLVLKYGNGVYTGTFTSPPYSLEPKALLYLEISSLPVAANLGELFTVFVAIGNNSTQSFTNTFY